MERRVRTTTCLMLAAGTAILIAGAAAPVGCPFVMTGSPPPVVLDVYASGQDPGSASDLLIGVGEPIVWTYVVTNKGNSRLMSITVSDNRGAVGCPKAALEIGESMTCTASDTALAGQHLNTGTVVGMAAGVPVTVSNACQYVGVSPSISMEMLTNGDDADVAPGPSVSVGSTVLWTCVVTNPGNTRLTDVNVSDNQGAAATCPRTVLEPGEAMVCTASAIAVVGQYSNVGTATGTPPVGPAVKASDAGHYFGVKQTNGNEANIPPLCVSSSINIQKLTNGYDSDLPPGASVAVGSPVLWTYVVTNTGGVRLTDVTVNDGGGAAVTCPATALEPGESMVCTASGTAVAGQYASAGTATGTPTGGGIVTASDASHYFGVTPSIALEKQTNGDDAEVAPGPSIAVGAPVSWTYVVTNSGDVALTDVTVSDDKGVVVSCPKTTLDLGESMTCTGSGTAVAGQYSNVGTVTGTSTVGRTVTASDASHYLGVSPSINIQKLTNGDDADVAPGPSIVVGAPVSWIYVVTNTGDVGLADLVVSDDKGVVVSCPKTTLDPGESMTCTGSGTATIGQYSNVGTVTGTSAVGTPVTASDASHYLGGMPAISIEKLTNGEDADTPPGVTVLVGSAVQWIYVVTNSGDVGLANVTVTDDKGVTVTCPKTTLTPGESMTCTGSGTAVAGQYANVGTATGTPPDGPDVTASDASHYYGEQLGNQGCTPGYWKNHTDSWPPTGYSPGQTVKTVFDNVMTFYPACGNATLLQSLGFDGGPGNEGAAEILLRAGTAALLNASHPGVAYPRTEASVIADVNTALLGSQDQMLVLAAALDADNNRGCPLN